MPTKIRLQRKGKKGQPFYHLVVADGRAPRDGKFIERLGTYNPMTHPATIEINFDRSLHWVQVGAQPTDTARSILSNKGVMLMHHLMKGVKKGALTEEEAQERLQEWLKDKEARIDQVAKDAMLAAKEKNRERIEAERKVNETREAELARKRAKENLKVEEAAAAQAEAKAAETEAAEAKAPEAEAPQPEVADSKTEEPKAEKAQEGPEKEEPKAEKAQEEPEKEEPKAE